VHPLWVYTIKNPGRLDTFVSGTTAAGSRAVPSRNYKDDVAIGARIDNGEVYEKDGRRVKAVYMQPNKNATNQTLKKLADKDAHQKLTWAEIPIDENATKEEKLKIVQQVFEDLKKNI
jgi:hypothetical protein